ncbi:MAG: helix-turn-helix transcriptional regulator [Oscillospiraceae bacterium]
MFYENLIKECRKQGLKVTPLVIECGGASGSISGWKNGAMPNSEIVVKLAKRLNVSCDYLLSGEDAFNYNNLDRDEKELLNNYKMLDNRGKHKLHIMIYDELDFIKKDDDL